MEQLKSYFNSLRWFRLAMITAIIGMTLFPCDLRANSGDTWFGDIILDGAAYKPNASMYDPNSSGDFACARYEELPDGTLLLLNIIIGANSENLLNTKTIEVPASTALQSAFAGEYKTSSGNVKSVWLATATDRRTNETTNEMNARLATFRNSIETVILPSSVKNLAYIESYPNLTSINTDNIEYFGASEADANRYGTRGNSRFSNSNFQDKPSLETISLASMQFAGSAAFSMNYFDHITIPNNFFPITVDYDYLVNTPSADSPFFRETNLFSSSHNLKTVTLGPDVYYIPHSCFIGCHELESINLDNVTYYAPLAFSGCRSLVIDSLDWTDKIVNVFEYPFNDVTFKWLHIDPSNLYIWASAGNSWQNSQIFQGVKNSRIFLDGNYVIGKDYVGCYLSKTTKNGQSVYYTDPSNIFFVPINVWESYQTAEGWKDIKEQIYPWPCRYIVVDGEIKIGNGLTYVDDDNTKTTRLTSTGGLRNSGDVMEVPGEFPDGYKTVAVTGCQMSNWSQVILPSTVDSLSSNAFASSSKLETINLQYITKLDNSAIFPSCSKLNHVTLNPQLKTLPNSMFHSCSSLNEINLDYITTLKGSVFYGCSSLTDVNMPALTKMETSDFKGCTNLETLSFASLSKIPEQSFNGLEKLHAVILDAVDTIGNNAFRDCTNLTKVFTSNSTSTLAFPATLRYIGNSAFARAPLEGDLYFENGITKIGKFAFRESHITSLYLPETLVTPLQDITFFNGSNNTSGVDFEQSSFAVDSAAFNRSAYLERVDIAEGVNAIGNSVFQFCPKLKIINLPNSMKYIGAHFACGAREMESLTIPASVTDIDGAFLHGCESLRNVYLLGDPSMLKLTSRGGESFGPVDPVDDWDAIADYRCKHVNDCLFTVNDEETYNNYINYVNLDSEKPWLRLDRYDFDYNLCGSDNDGTLTSDHINWTTKKYYKTEEHIADFPRNKGLDGLMHPNAYEDAKAAIYGGANARAQKAARRITPAQKETYKDLYTLTGYHNRYNYFQPDTILALPEPKTPDGQTPPAPSPDPDPEPVPIYDKWSTICFPFKPKKSELDEIIGEKGIIAEYISCWRIDSEDPSDTDCLYGLSFKAINHDDIVPDKPYLIRPATGLVANIPMYSEEALPIYNNQPTPMTAEHRTAIVETENEATNEAGTHIYMIGKYVDYWLSKAEFYLNNKWNYNDNAWAMRFYKASANNIVKVKPFKCFFRIVKNGVPVSNARLSTTFSLEDEEGGTTTIERLENHGRYDGAVYNLNGQKVANRLEDAHLLSGVYIVNGRKVIVSKK